MSEATVRTAMIGRQVYRTTCTIDGCGRAHSARGLCNAHYIRAQKAGTLADYPTQAVERVDLPGEEWRPVPGYEGVYEVSNLGRIYRCKEDGFARSGRLIRSCIDPRGYLVASLNRDGKSRTRGVHQIVALAFLGPRPPGQEVRHLDGDRTNPCLENLRYGTPSENMQDCLRHGTHNHLRKTHCPYGHEYDLVNTYIQPSSGGRKCRICKARRAREYEERQKARRAA